MTRFNWKLLRDSFNRLTFLVPGTYRAGRYAIGTSDYPLRVPETMVFPERLFMRLIKGSLAGLILAGILAMMPAAAFAHGGGGGGGGGHGGGGGRGFGGGHTFGGFTGRGFSPGFMGGEPHFSGASARDFAFHDGRFNNRFFAHDRFFRH